MSRVDAGRCDGCGRREPVTEIGAVALCDGCAHYAADEVGTVDLLLRRAADALDPLRALDRRERLAWGGALGLFVAGDVVTTRAGLALGAVETNPVALATFDAVGVLPAMLGVKAAVLTVAGLGWACCPTSARVVSPATLAVIGGAVTVANGAVLATLAPDPAVAVGALLLAWTALIAVGVAR